MKGEWHDKNEYANQKNNSHSILIWINTIRFNKCEYFWLGSEALFFYVQTETNYNREKLVD